MDFETICKKIEKLEIQGASNVAKHGIQALEVLLDEEAPKNKREAIEVLEDAKNRLFQTRPTEPFLRNSVRYIVREAKKAENVSTLIKTVETSKSKFFRTIEEGKEKIAEVGSKRISGTVLTHCHSSTAMGILKRSKDDIEKVYVTESRPKYQGRISARELLAEGIETVMIVDAACRHYMKEMDYCLVGSDVITSEGNVINKIGTSSVALAANEARIPFYVATNLLKFDPKTISGALETIEERNWKEVWKDKPKKLTIKNPAFDVTPEDYIDGLITEAGIISPEMIVHAIRDRFPWIFAH